MNHRIALNTTILLAGMATVPVLGQQVPVKHTQGAMRGFLVIRSQSNSVLGFGDYSEFAVGERVTQRLTLHFKDGSLDDETTVFTQNKTFQLISDHHIQHGPFFKNNIDMLVEANGNVTMKSIGHDGKEKVETNHMDLPADIANGIVAQLLLNVSPTADPFSVGMVLPSGKGRLARLQITSGGSGTFYPVTGDRSKASLFRIHIDLGGVAGVVAPIIGKQPSDIIIWICEGEVPVLVREQAQLAEGSPTISLELAGTSYPRGK